MCTVSNIVDYGRTTIPQRYPWIGDQTFAPIPPPSPTQAEFDALKREVESLKELLRAAKKYDDDTGQADCESDEKIAALRKIAELVGVSLDDVLTVQENSE